MLKSELLEIIANGENSGVEFKRDDCEPEKIAKEIVAMANLNGGMILIGVEDDGTITGIQRPNLEEWIMDGVVGRRIHPLIIPFYEEIQIEEGKRVAVVSFTQGTTKPYVLRHKDREDIYIRVGTVSKLASREVQARLFEIGGMLHIENLPVSGTSIESLDSARLKDYLENIVRDTEIPATEKDWEHRLCGLSLMIETKISRPVCTIAGLLLFGYLPRRYLKQSGFHCVVYDGVDKGHKAKMDKILDAPMVALWGKENEKNRELIAPGLIENFIQIATPFLSEESNTINENMRRERHWYYPLEAIREIIINALAHRDWTRSVDIEISIYSDRMEVISPGVLNNSMTIEKMIAGQRSPRNPLIVDILRDYNYVDRRGMGIRNKVIPLMRQENHSEPVFELTDDYLKTILYKDKKFAHDNF